MTARTASPDMILLTTEDRVFNEHGLLSQPQRHQLRRERILCIAAALAWVGLWVVLGAVLVHKVRTPAWAARGELWLWVPLLLVWLWVLRWAFPRWRQINHDLTLGRIMMVEGRVHGEWTLGVGIIRVPHYRVVVGAHTFHVTKHTFFQFTNHGWYRMFFTPTASVLVGAIAVVPEVVTAQPVPTAPAAPTVPPPAHVLVEPLTAQEQAIVHLIAQGLSNKEIATHLALSPNTIKMYTSQVYRKLGVRRRTEAVARARELQLL